MDSCFFASLTHRQPQRRLRRASKFRFLISLLLRFCFAVLQGVTAASLAAAVARLEPPPHRMELVGTVVGTTRVGTGVGTAAAGVSYVNDSKATNVESTLAGLEGLPREQKVVVLLGGKAKEGVAGA